MNDGGPAFPRNFMAFACGENVELTVPEPGPPGMSLRDWFAGMATQGWPRRHTHRPTPCLHNVKETEDA